MKGRRLTRPMVARFISSGSPRMSLPQAARPPSLRIEGPGSVARKETKREDRNYNRQQCKPHMARPYGEADSPSLRRATEVWRDK